MDFMKPLLARRAHIRQLADAGSNPVPATIQGWLSLWKVSLFFV
jgi:hypothetical protein